jgi:hypothetical protein
MTSISKSAALCRTNMFYIAMNSTLLGKWMTHVLGFASTAKWCDLITNLRYRFGGVGV